MEDLLRQILDTLRRIERRLDSLGALGGGIPVTDEKSLEILKEYEHRDLAEFIMRRGPPPRLPDECPTPTAGTGGSRSSKRIEYAGLS